MSLNNMEDFISKEYTFLTDGDRYLSIFRSGVTIIIELWDEDDLLSRCKLQPEESNRLSNVLEMLLWIGD